MNLLSPKTLRGQEEGQLGLCVAFGNMEDIEGHFGRHLGWEVGTETCLEKVEK